MLSLEERQLIKTVPITSYLAGKQIFPVLQTGGEYCYFSPFRNERTPSFFVNPAKNVYIDFCDGYGGDSIKLVQALDNVGFAQAVAILQSVDQSFEIELQANLPASPQYQSFVKRITPIHHHALISYITSVRKVSLAVARKELSEIHYRTSKGEFFSLGFKNESDGWELRNPSFKGCIGQKDISIRGNRSGRFAYVFEGFIDYLSFVTCHAKRIASQSNDTCFYILNSLSLVNRLPDLERFEIVSLFLDNDEPGIKAADHLASKYSNTFNYSAILFPQHKDYNAYHANKL